MVLKLVEEEFLLDTPFLQRICDEGRREGQLMAYRDSIVDALILRFDLPNLVLCQIERQLRQVTELDRLEELFALAIQENSLEIFQTRLTEMINT